MVGIILASHGDFAKGILQSGSMIFGEQENVQAVTLAAHEGPDDIKKKMEDAIATFKPDDPVLFLIDLWGGTPFNQASGLLNGHEDKWAIITGMNLPMLIEAYSSRFSMNSAQEIAAHIYETARDGVKIKPETLQPKEAAAPAAAAVPKGRSRLELSWEMEKSRSFWHGSTPGSCTAKLQLHGQNR
jgi:PTS system mannose-specific IIB component